MNVNAKEQIARKMYDTYCQSVGGKAYNGDDLPKSSEFFEDPSKERQANGWRDAAESASELIHTLDNH